MPHNIYHQPTGQISELELQRMRENSLAGGGRTAPNPYLADALRNARGQITEAEMGAFNDLNQMSGQSPTGGALGQISGAEMGALGGGIPREFSGDLKGQISDRELQDMILKERYMRY